MNILIICGYGAYQNLSGSFIHAQAAAYTALGHRVRALVFTPVGKHGWNGRRFFPSLLPGEVDGVELRFLRFLSLSRFGENGFNTASAIRALRSSWKSALDGFSPDVIHAHTVLLSPVGAWLKELLKIPLVLTVHGSDVLVPFAKGQFAKLRVFADYADHLVCVSTLLKRRMEDCSAAVSMSVILNGFQVNNISSSPNRPPLSLIQAGYLIARKKADVTIRALAVLQKRHPEATLDIVGSGSGLASYQKLCKDLGISKAVRFHGFLPNPQLMAKLAEARFFVMPSVNEGFGIVYLEAMASGCITIGTEGEGIADLVVSGKNGFLVPPDDPDAIVQAIEWCLAHPEESTAIAERGRSAALTLTWEKNAGQYLQLFQALKRGDAGLWTNE